MNYLCWRADYGDSFEHADKIRVPYGTCSEAAEAFVEKHFSDWEFPTSAEVTLCEAGDEWERCGPDKVFEVDVESVPAFHAFEVKP
jgi:hypothetical protein